MKESKNNQTIHIVTPGVSNRAKHLSAVKVEQLGANLKSLVDQLHVVLQGVPNLVGSFSFDEIVLSAEISGKGEFTLLGSGISAEGKGGVQLKFKRSRES